MDNNYNSDNEFKEIEETTETQTEPFVETEDISDVSSSSEEPIFENSESKDTKSGAKVFMIILCVAVAVIIAISGGYLAGVSNKSTKGPNTVTDIAQKPTDIEPYDTEKLYASSVSSVVSIVVYNSKTGASVNASGVVFSDNGYIITNDHIYADISSPALVVIMSDGTEYKASYVAGDSRTDISVIKIDAENLTPAVFGDSTQISVGEKVAAIGYSAGPNEKAVFTSGYISSTGTRTTNSSTYSIKMIQTDTVINPGSSGGALYNMYGQVIGITSSKLTGSGYEGINYAVPTNTAVSVANSLIENGYVAGRGRLGITYSEVNFVTATIRNCPMGLRIESISDDSSLKGKGLMVGDIITHINGTEITNSSIALEVFESTQPDVIITLSVYSATTGETVTVYATLIQDGGSSSYTENAGGSLPVLPDDDSGTIIK